MENIVFHSSPPSLDLSVSSSNSTSIPISKFQNAHCARMAPNRGESLVHKNSHDRSRRDSPSQLPWDVQHIIMDFLSSEPGFVYENRTTRPTLVSLALVNKNWNVFAIPRLYEHIRLTSVCALEKLCWTLKTSSCGPMLANLIKSVVFSHVLDHSVFAISIWTPRRKRFRELFGDIRPDVHVDKLMVRICALCPKLRSMSAHLTYAGPRTSFAFQYSDRGIIVRYLKGGLRLPWASSSSFWWKPLTLTGVTHLTVDRSVKGWFKWRDVTLALDTLQSLTLINMPLMLTTRNGIAAVSSFPSLISMRLINCYTYGGSQCFQHTLHAPNLQTMEFMGGYCNTTTLFTGFLLPVAKTLQTLVLGMGELGAATWPSPAQPYFRNMHSLREIRGTGANLVTFLQKKDDLPPFVSWLAVEMGNDSITSDSLVWKLIHTKLRDQGCGSLKSIEVYSELFGPSSLGKHCPEELETQLVTLASTIGVRVTLYDTSSQ